jgi:predicted HAD superfamily Cof-like phosphohydrolase
MNRFNQQHNLSIYCKDRQTIEAMALRTRLILEEWTETLQAISEWESATDETRTHAAAVEILDGLTDLLYVTYGAAYTFGLDIDEAFKRIHESNMSKLGADGKPIYRDDGKVIKGPNYQPPTLDDIVKESGMPF